MSQSKKRPHRRVDPIRDISECEVMGEHVRRLRAMPRLELIEEYRRLWGKKPRVKHHGWLWKRCAWRLQTNLLGGLSTKAKERLEELIAQLERELAWDKPAPQSQLRKPAADGPAPGTSLTREYHGKTIAVRVLDDGFEWEGERYRSLSAVAKAITGNHCSGRAFFGIAKRRAKA
jgi:DUF2924 family protein